MLQPRWTDSNSAKLRCTIVGAHRGHNPEHQFKDAHDEGGLGKRKQLLRPVIRLTEKPPTEDRSAIPHGRGD